jgi:ribonuclease J
MTDEQRPPKSPRRRRWGRPRTQQPDNATTQAATPPAPPPEPAAGQARPPKQRGQQNPPAKAQKAPAATGQKQPRQPQQRAQNNAQPGTSGPRGKLRVIPLGGVGEVGKNMTLVEYENDLIILDCGAKFPEEEQRGIDLIIPDVTYVKERRNNLRGIVITHGHEDHIGGLPYIIPLLKRKQPIPIYGSPLALGFIEGKLLEHRLDKAVELRRVAAGERVQLGKLSAEFIHVTHSIPDTNAIAVHSPVGTIIDTADFKFDPTPVMGEATDERRLRRLGDQGVLALFSDTVRVETAGSTPSEKVVLDTIDEVVRTSKGQVIIATFASNISRLYMALLAAERHGRKVAVAGRSMDQNSRVALGLGYLDPAPGLFVSLDEVTRLPREKRLIVVTGSQGEPEAALSRIAAGEHQKIKVAANDVVLVSATPVPGNEETVARTIDNLFRRGVKVIYSAVERGVHVSGHAGRDELRKMIDLVRPRFVVPIHGEFRHMVLYRELCNAAGIPSNRVLLPEIGGVIEFTKDSANHRGRIPSGTLLVDRLGDRGAGQVILRDRDHIADDGVVVVTIVVNRESGQLIAGPDIVAKGLRPELNQTVLTEAENELKKTLDRRSKGEPQVGYIISRAKETVAKSLYRRSKSRPMVLPVVTEL